MTLPTFLWMVQLLFLAAEFIAGGIDMYYVTKSLKTIVNADWSNDLSWAAAKAEADGYKVKAALAARWMWAMLAVVIALVPIVVIASASQKG